MTTPSKMDFNKMRSFFFFGLIVLLGLAFLYLVRPFLYPLFWAAVIAVMFYPMHRRIHSHIRLHGLSAFLSVLVVLVVIILPVILLGILLFTETVSLVQSVNRGQLFQSVGDVATKLEGTAFGPIVQTIQSEWTGYAQTATQHIGSFLFEQAKSITQNSVRFVFMLFLMIYTLYYFFRDGHRMLKRLMHLSPLGDKYESMLYERFTSATKATLKSTFIVGGIQGILGGILFWITGVPGAFVWGVIMTALSIIPAVGSFLIWLPAAIIMLAFGFIWQGVTILVVGALVISMVDNLLRPPLVGRDIQMHPLVVLFSTLGGIIVFGISGFIIGPVIAALFLSIMSIYDYYYQHELSKN